MLLWLSKVQIHSTFHLIQKCLFRPCLANLYTHIGQTVIIWTGYSFDLTSTSYLALIDKEMQALRDEDIFPVIEDNGEI